VSDTVLAAVLPQDGSCPGRLGVASDHSARLAVWPPSRRRHVMAL